MEWCDWGEGGGIIGEGMIVGDGGQLCVLICREICKCGRVIIIWYGIEWCVSCGMNERRKERWVYW